jgi:hypothetical protein
MLVEGGYLHSMKRLIEKAAETDAPAERPSTRMSWRSARLVLALLGGSSGADLTKSDDASRRRERANDSQRR